MLDFIQTITDEELEFISMLDYGEEASSHLKELKSLIFKQNGIRTEKQYWHPYEVIELGSYALKKGHEREFVTCILIRILNVKEGADGTSDLEHLFKIFSENCDKIPPELSKMLFKEFESAGL
tara:strand:- start:3333 stop:3701 length:369 start_codon:yes stop_codon:yes gene_type:complete